MKFVLFVLFAVSGITIGLYCLNQYEPSAAKSVAAMTPKERLDVIAKGHGGVLMQYLDQGGGNLMVTITQDRSNPKDSGPLTINQAVEAGIVRHDWQLTKSGSSDDNFNGPQEWWQYHVFLAKN